MYRCQMYNHAQEITTLVVKFRGLFSTLNYNFRVIDMFNRFPYNRNGCIVGSILFFPGSIFNGSL